MKINRLNVWPHVHICVFDLSCWCEMYLYGAPMRVHWRGGDWLIPGPLRWYADRKSNQMWDKATPVKISARPAAQDPTSSTAEGSP